MATNPPGGMIGRIRAILTEPKSAFERIDAEPATVSGIMTGWVVPLAAIGPVAMLIGNLAFYHRIGASFAIGQAVISYVLALAGAYVMSFVIDALAPSFGGQKNQVQAMKAYAYSMTAAYLAGIFAIIPMLAILGLVGLYSFYLLYVALPIMMKSPPDKAIGYVIVTIVVAIVIWWVIAAVAGAAMLMILGGPVIGAGYYG